MGGVAGFAAARRFNMTDMPQLVSLFNAVGGCAAALVAIVDAQQRPAGLGAISGGTGFVQVADISIGALTFTGSLVAAKLEGLVPGRPVVFRGARGVNLVLAVAVLAAALLTIAGTSPGWALAIAGLATTVLGVTFVLPIGGADIPVVVSLLNGCTGMAVAMAGLLLSNTVLITAGALVGASGTILTALMAKAMNRSLGNIIAGGFGSGDQTAPPSVTGADSCAVQSVTADDVALQPAYAGSVIVVPGYGLAAARAQSELVDLADTLIARGITVSYAIHPVAGRMSGHVPYEQMLDRDAANRAFGHTDVALVVGANDVVNPAARTPGSAVYGMPILDAHRAGTVIVVKRSMGHGYADIDNPLCTAPRPGCCSTTPSPPSTTSPRPPRHSSADHELISPLRIRR
ncbi:NAD(P) transhydrogenase subunit beta [Kribbella orskensis]|uniref:proton-translocating NAD(P)(+) transhydrogenase n=1 Tax=Kribbella orskensis TaxID=2512216 RepID=A0ABY2B8E0_9ACTN|nr:MULTISPECIES: NAD(P)(+) transhydrogenase (Re/Si-specific) subunit beta [Kribbella]TCN30679.1 NAD(P) transhydrogenase subunit beta [Kribbella sp. VKM Ac-2500]TCO11398.1 NAD(P) transhydrogenase subunit beta [Kribbella orskensis]